MRSQEWSWQTRDLPHGKLVRENVWSRRSLFNSERYSSVFKAKRNNTEGRGKFEGKMLVKVKGGVQGPSPTQGCFINKGKGRFCGCRDWWFG